MENASLTSEPTLEKRTAKLQRAVAQRATEARQDALKLDFQAAPGGEFCTRGEEEEEPDVSRTAARGGE